MLRCGENGDCTSGPAQRVYVLGYSIDFEQPGTSGDPNDATVMSRLNAIAAAGGAASARFASDGASLRGELTQVLDEIRGAN
jgi:hypothetical protein